MNVSRFFIRDMEQARAILNAYQRCAGCSECPLDTPEGWRCSYMAEQAEKYIENHGEAVQYG